MKSIKDIYKDYPEQPYFSPDRTVDEILASKTIPRRNMERTEEGLLPGAIILLWRINFGTFSTETTFSKYFEYSYGIDAKAVLQELIDIGYVRVESAFESIDHLSAAPLKALLKEKGVKGISKMKKLDIDQALKDNLTEEELGKIFSLRGLALTDKGQAALANNQAVVDKHPQKKI